LRAGLLRVCVPARDPGVGVTKNRDVNRESPFDGTNAHDTSPGHADTLRETRPVSVPYTRTVVAAESFFVVCADGASTETFRPVESRTPVPGWIPQFSPSQYTKPWTSSEIVPVDTQSPIVTLSHGEIPGPQYPRAIQSWSIPTRTNPSVDPSARMSPWQSRIFCLPG